MNANDNVFRFGTKSETLQCLKPLVSSSAILPIYFFEARDWASKPEQVLAGIRHFHPCSRVIIRSSAFNEDSASNSMAGAFTSCLDIDVSNTSALQAAIDLVIASFASYQRDDNQILVQPMLQNIQMSGVVMTHDLERGAPYYVFNYDDESGLTDTITGGIGIQKTVLIYRATPVEQLRSRRLQAVLLACRELESLCGNVPLDIEFAVDHAEQVYILQVRRITLCTTWHPVTERRVTRQLQHVKLFLKQRLGRQIGLYGATTLLGVMPDWNPAEIIGTTPRPLAASLYRLLVTDEIWRYARARMGYHHPENHALMIMLGGHPYIDVRCSFNSFLPAKLPPIVAEKLINAWMDRLRQHPEWHDKVEFEVVPTCLDFCFDDDFSTRYAGVLSDDELQIYRHQLSQLTWQTLSGRGQGGLQDGLDMIAECVKFHTRDVSALPATLEQVKELLMRCKVKGTLAFSMLARHAFIAEALLRSACRCGAITHDRLQEWKQSIHTVTTELAHNYASVCQHQTSLNDFLHKYGHLRPGTYDITSLRYDERHDLFTTQNELIPDLQPAQSHFELSIDEITALQVLLVREGWDLTAQALMGYAGKAIQAREYAKLVFTRDLSDALLVLTRWGGQVGLAREDLSFLDISLLLDTLTVPLMDEVDRVFLQQVTNAQNNCDQGKTLKLAHLITSLDDLQIVPLHRSMPNYITSQNVEAEMVLLRQDSPVTLSLENKIICIENADPGYDWIFTRKIKGLVTQYGGANSHMAIRCAEFGIPAAIGCGEQLFSRLYRGCRIALNCQAKTLTVM